MTDSSTQARYLAAARKAISHFPVAVQSLDLINVSENITWKVTGPVGVSYVLRLHRPGYHSLEELNAERLWIRALDAAGISVPQGIRTSSGAEYATVQIGDTSEWRHAGLAHWAEGEVLGDQIDSQAGFLDDPERIERWFGQLGALIAAMHNQASAWAVPASFKRHSLDAHGLMGDSPFWGRFWEASALDGEQSALLSQVRARLFALLSRLDKSPDTYSVIHADLHSYNLLVDGSTLSVIDFDDAGFGWHAYDLAVALLPYRTAPTFSTVHDAVLRGYRSVRPLAEHVTGMIPTFLLVRRLAIVGWMMHRPELGRSLEPAAVESLCRAVREYREP
jgi:Ser/Thr protein kinase RdoA (MazF antagonist)